MGGTRLMGCNQHKLSSAASIRVVDIYVCATQS